MIARYQRLAPAVIAVGLVTFAGCERFSSIEHTSLPTITFNIEAATADMQQGGRLSWTSRNVSQCEARGDWSGVRATQGSQPIRASDSDTYELRCTGEHGSARARASSAALRQSAPAFPLRWSANRRYLVDSRDQPFLIHGDSAWSLIAELKAGEVTRYFVDRRARGFNTVLMNLIEHKFASAAPRNAYGEAPFATSGTLQKPNDAYFDRAERVIKQAAEQGFLVLLVPAYLGYGGQDEGWYKEVAATSRSALTDYGRYIGRRFQKYDNVIWTYGGDHNPPDRSVVLAIAAGVREFDQRISTAHTAPETAAREFWGNESWLQLNNIYTYKDVAAKAAAEYRRMPAMPFFLLESSYENEQTDDVSLVRAHAYRALLSGAAGHIFGNNPIWHFSGPGLYPQPTSWVQALNSPGARSMTHLRKLFDAYPWWTLVPDFEHTLIDDHRSEESARTVAAISRDRDFAFVYFPRMVTVRVHASALACGLQCQATWLDPATGTHGPTTPIRNKEVSLRPPARNGGREEDWLLLIEADSG